MILFRNLKKKIVDIGYPVLILLFGYQVGVTYSYYIINQKLKRYEFDIYNYIQALRDVKDGDVLIRDGNLILYPNNKDTIIQILIRKEKIRYEK